MVGLANRKIKDARLIKLICKFLKAGYMENWQYHKTYSGTPQGGIISPLLANICLHELDKFVLSLKEEFDQRKLHEKRTLSNGTKLIVPLTEKVQKFLFDNGAVAMKNGRMTPVHRKKLLHLTDLKIVSTCNAERRGICNYYSLTSNFHKLSYFA